MNPSILLKSDERTDPDYGCPPSKRTLADHLRNGIVNIDKPPGPTSHQVSAWVKKILGLDKAGHSGTLDPKVTGVFPIALSNSVKVVQALLLSDKEYVCVMALHKKVPRNKVHSVFKEFTGRIYQRPPLKSSVKRRLRIRTIYKLDLLEMAGNNVLFTVRCEAGTYIRKLCHDFGLVLDTGAHMAALRRTKAGPYDESSLVSLHDLIDAWAFYQEDGDEELLRKYVQTVESAVSHLGSIWIKDGAVGALCHGATLNAPGISKLSDGIKKDDLIAIYTIKDELVALGRSLQDSQAIMDMNKGHVADLERVVMAQDVYPRLWHSK